MTEIMALSGNSRSQPQNKDQGSTPTSFPDVVELNVGGQVYYTRHATLISAPNSLLGKIFSPKKDNLKDLARDPKGRYFIDRDGFLFRYVLDYLRDKQIVLPDHFPERGRLKREAEYYQLPELVKILTPEYFKQSPDDYFHSDIDDISQGSDQKMCPPSLGVSDRRYGFITVGYRGSCTLNRESQRDAKFRRVPRIMISGRIALAKEVFGETLNESRDPDRTPDRYTSRFYLKFKHLERAFDMLSECGFQMVACNSSVTASFVNQYTEDKIWSSYTEYVFYRGPSRWSSSNYDCCCKDHKEDGEGESGTSDNDLSSSSSGSQSEASSPQGTVVCGPVSRQSHIQTLDRPTKRGQGPPTQQSERCRKSDLLRTLTSSSREANGSRRRPAKERLTVEQELEKCIQDFHKIKIPERFPERKTMWQSDLLRKYRL
ncbi:BTB/POZ domain-containing protein KCTD16b [Paramormyrops kingsleyae]|uniref:Potassium channel tetramerization domain containing 16b n=1 Tax=Paramormyrops kingsleyae TaxID=1676925 RepID=A0A3B3QVD9_9TELE|nr:BTB/POZ domain-containing protein KCTD16-like [Paramormyrops kingsleyae]